MRRPRHLDHADDRKKSRRIMMRLLAVYFSFGVLLVAVTHVKAKFTDPQAEPARQEAVAR